MNIILWVDKMIKLYFEGIILGLGKILPGVSGTIFAIIFGIYDECIKNISIFPKNLKKTINFFTPLLFGITTSIIILSKMVIYLINNYYNETMSFFLGLLIENSKELYKKSKINVKKDMKSFIISILLVLVANIKIREKIVTIPNNIIGNFFLGSIEAFSSIVPGVSGTSILIILNSYDRVLLRFSEVLNIKTFQETIKFFTPFTLGLVLNIIIFSKIINKALKNYNKTYTIIFGIIISSIILLFLNIKKINLVTIIFFCTGILLIKIINKYLNK